MKKNRGKLIIISIFIVLSVYFLFPTYRDYELTKHVRTLHGDDSTKFIDQNEEAIRNAKLNRLKLGLDLQGGMRIVLEVNTTRLIENLAKNKDDAFNTAFAEVQKEAATTDEDVVSILQRIFTQKQLRAARYYGSIRETDDQVYSRLNGETSNAIDRAIEIVRNRVDQYGVSEPSIQKQGGRRIIVELPGVSNKSEVERLLQGTALLEFKLMSDPEIMAKVYQSIDKYLAARQKGDTLLSDTGKTLASTDTTTKPAADTSALAALTKNDTSKTSDTTLGATDDQTKTPEELKKEHPFFVLANPMQQQNQSWSGELYTMEDDRAKVMAILHEPEIHRIIPSGVTFVWGAKSATTIGGKKYFPLYAVKKEAELTGGVITDARATIDPSFNTPVVNMTMNTEGAHEWARITGANVHKRIAIILDSACFSAPEVRTKITGGNSQIEGMANIEEAKLLEIVLKAGALPAPVDIIQETSVGPSLGEDSIQKGVIAAGLALLLTAVFMVFYYSTGGTMADIALFLNILFVLGVLAGFQGTLTLPGIAGLILTVAVAVDANVLIFERIREELAGGKTLTAGVDAGYSIAFKGAIFDSNFTAFITGVILYQFGTGPVKGFALTLMIGIIASVFSAVVVSHVVIDMLIERGKHVKFE